MPVDPIPQGYHTVTPYLFLKDARAFIDFAGRAFGAREQVSMEDEAGAVRHAEIEIGDSRVMLSQATDDYRPLPLAIHLYVEDCDATYAAAIEAGAESTMEPADQFYGDRMAGVRDAEGQIWWIATHVEDVPPEEMERRAKAANG